MDERGRGQRLALAGPDGQHQGQWHVATLREVHPVRQRGPGQMRGVDHHDDRAGAGQAAQDPQQGRVQHGGAEQAVGEHGQQPGRRRQGEQRPEQRLVGAEQVGGPVRPEPPQQGGERTEQCVQRHAPVERPARCHENGVPGRLTPGGPGTNQSGLADARVPVDHHDLDPAGAGPHRDRIQAGQLAVTADDPR